MSCIPAGKMSKAKKVLDEAREIQNPELDLADKSISTFEEMPGLRESSISSWDLFRSPNLATCLDWFLERMEIRGGHLLLAHAVGVSPHARQIILTAKQFKNQ